MLEHFNEFSRLIVFRPEREKVCLRDRSAVFVRIKDCIAFRQHICDRIDDSCGISAVDALDAWIAVLVSSDVKKAARSYQRRKSCTVEQHVRIVQRIYLLYHQVIAGKSVIDEPVRQTVNSFRTPAERVRQAPELRRYKSIYLPHLVFHFIVFIPHADSHSLAAEFLPEIVYPVCHIAPPF